MKTSEICEKYPAFHDLVRSHFKPEDRHAVMDSLEIADKALAGLMRYNGKPLIGHSVGVARIVIEEFGLGVAAVSAALLHDAYRLGKIPAQESGLFTDECAGILDSLCSISNVDIKQDADQADNFRDLIVAYSGDPSVILIKLADRLEVMRSLSMFPLRKRKKKSWETINLYAQIAHKLGLYNVKSEMEDISLSFLEPEQYRNIVGRLKESSKSRERFIASFLRPVEEKMKEAGIKYHIKSRTKSVYSIWSKMKKLGLPLEEIYDIFALRVIIDAPPELEKQLCWSVYSIFTDFYTPNPERLRDWISIPKSNGYESLHTTVVTPQGKWVEVQIRTERMDLVAERGIAAHWKYKGVGQGGHGSDRWLASLRELIEEDPGAARKKLGSVSIGEVFVFTPNGDLRKMPEGATVLDFAFDIHTELGSSCTGGRINGKMVPIREKLRNGDIVEVLSSRTQKPKRSWLSVAVTNKAQTRIRAFLRDEQSKAAELGREELERKIRNWRVNISMDEAVTLLCKYYRVKTGTELYARIATGNIEIIAVKPLLIKHCAGEPLADTAARKTPAVKVRTEPSGDGLVIDDTIRNLDYRLARCCNPIRGDKVFGFVTINSGIAIHREECPNGARLRQRYPYRIINARWREETSGGWFQASIYVVADNEVGMLTRITDLITGGTAKANIRSISMAPNSHAELCGTVNVEVDSDRTIDIIIRGLQKIRGLHKAYRKI